MNLNLLLHAIAAAIATSNTVSASLIGIDFYILQANGTKLCLTADQQNVAGPVKIAECDGSDLQLWSYDKGDDFKNQYVNRATRTCLAGTISLLALPMRVCVCVPFTVCVVCVHMWWA